MHGLYIYEFVWQWGSGREQPLFEDAAGFHTIKYKVLFANYLTLKKLEDKPISCKDVF